MLRIKLVLLAILGTLYSAAATASWKVNCNSKHKSGCYRGMYFQPYSEKVGQVDFVGDEEEFAYIMGDDAKEQKVIDFIKAQRIDSVAFYNLHVILVDEMFNELAAFLTKLREAGVEQLIGIGADATLHWDEMLEFHNNYVKFDGFLTEIEYWQAGAPDIDEFIELLEYVRDLDWEPTDSGTQPFLASYVGWITQSDTDLMAPLLDYIYVHVYVNEASLAYGYAEDRLGYIASANERLGTNVKVYPIFSAEDNDWAAGTEYFMGEWLEDNCIPTAESTWMTDFEAANWGDNLQMAGNMFYEYFFIAKYLEANCFDNPCASNKYLYLDDTCQDECDEPFTATVQFSCVSPCHNDEYTFDDQTCSVDCDSPNVAHEPLGDLQYCESDSGAEPSDGEEEEGEGSTKKKKSNSWMIAGIVAGATVFVAINCILIRKAILNRRRIAKMGSSPTKDASSMKMVNDTSAMNMQ